MRHKLEEEDLKMFLIQNALDDPETKRDLKMQDLKTFDEIKAQINKCDEVKKKIETEAECAAAINKPNSYARAAKLKEGEYCNERGDRKNPDTDHLRAPVMNKGGKENRWEIPCTRTIE